MSDTDRLEPASMARAFREARRRGMDVEPAVLFHDLGRMRARIGRISAAFPPGALHAVAIKANPLVEVLRAAVDCGAGLEAASLEEVKLAAAAGCPAGRIVYDSPAKTRDDIAEALRLGVRINADNLDELERIDGLVRGEEAGGRIGLRINPQVGASRIALTSVADRRSRFGVPLEQADAVRAAFARYRWLAGLHVHVGSQGCALSQLVDGIRRVEALRQEIRRALGPGAAGTMDIGGGLPVAYRSTDRPPLLEDYAAALRREVPTLFEEGSALITELGRWVQAGCGFAVSRVEYVKKDSAGRTAILHLGADFLLRRAYHPDDWHHDFVALDPGAAPKEGPLSPCTLGGPLCFGGDVLARDLPLPDLSPGDLVLIRDTGAYTLSMWSRHCSRGIPAVLGVDGGDVRVLRERERPEDVVAFWSRGRGQP
ncbi:diaminopimelate decarboxylase [Sorangium sp. So ce1335]|uniref:diaminopimelate decarboxylase n=1 Tax=Sorangium sp. So ce1335 TaxID=3133335 RepID=UPI003F6360D4